MVTPYAIKKVCLPNNMSIFTAEIHALDMGLRLGIIWHTRSKNFVIIISNNYQTLFPA